MTHRPGFIAIPRAVLDTEWWTEATPLARTLWLTWLCMANYSDSVTRKGLRLQPGQLVTSWKDTACRTSWIWKGGRVTPTVAECRAAAAFLRSAGEVTWFTSPVAAGGGLVVTLARWAFYAGSMTGATEVATAGAATPPVVPTATQEEKKAPVVTGAETPEERRQRTREDHQEERRRAIEETRRILAEERELRRGVPIGTVH